MSDDQNSCSYCIYLCNSLLPTLLVEYEGILTSQLSVIYPAAFKEKRLLSRPEATHETDFLSIKM
jgi:hypothetical protein